MLFRCLYVYMCVLCTHKDTARIWQMVWVKLHQWIWQPQNRPIGSKTITAHPIEIYTPPKPDTQAQANPYSAHDGFKWPRQGGATRFTWRIVLHCQNKPWNPKTVEWEWNRALNLFSGCFWSNINTYTHYMIHADTYKCKYLSLYHMHVDIHYTVNPYMH